MFAVCGMLGFVNFQASSVYASSPSADVWDGEYATSVGYEDYYKDDVLKTVYIRSASGFSYFADNVTNNNTSFAGYNVYLESDIDLNSKAWTPIGNASNSFEGNFHGQGHYIYNLKIYSSSDSVIKNVGLFASLKGNTASISNLHLSNFDFNVHGADYVGGLVAQTLGGTSSGIENCSVQGKIKSNVSKNVGGLIGGGTVRFLRNVRSNVEITTSAMLNFAGYASVNSCVGGIMGELANSSFQTEISLTSSHGKIETTNSYGKVGGLIGLISNNADIQNCYNASDVKGVMNDNYLGGLVGLNNAVLSVSTSYNSGLVENARDSSDNLSEFFVGGLVGNSVGTLNVSNCFNTELVKAVRENEQANATSNNLFNGLANASNVWYYSDNKMPNDSKAVYNLKELAKTSGFYANSRYWANGVWDFDKIWKISSGVNGSFPHLIANSFVNNDNSVSLQGEGTKENPYLIKTVADLQYINTVLAENANSSYYYSLENDLNLSGTRTWIPIGYPTHFSGVFDGNGHTISGLNSSLNAQFAATGLFGFTENAVIKNLTISNFVFVGSTNNDNQVGNLIGRIDKQTYVINCKDNSNTDKDTVGSVLEDNLLHIFAGKNNLEASGELDSNSVKGIKNFSGYDLTIYGQGGTFFNKNGSVYKGDYHVLVDTSNVVVNISGLDETYGIGGKENFLPVKTFDRDEDSDYVIYAGNELSGYFYKDASDDNGFATITGVESLVISGKVVSGIYANFVEKQKEVKVIYNRYEINNFDAKSEYSKTFKVDNDTYLYNNKEVFETTDAGLSNRLKLLDLEFYLDAEFEKLVYSVRETSEGVFERKLDDEGNNEFLINSNTTLYAKWVAKTCDSADSTKIVTIRFNKVDNESYNKFNLVDAVKRISLFKSGAVNAIEAFDESQIKGYTEIDGKVSFTFNVDTKHSDLITNYKEVLVELQDGYSVSGDTVVTYTEPDARFGNLKRNNENLKVTMYNLLADAVIDITLQVSEISNKLIIDNDLYMALAPDKQVSNDGVWIYTNGVYQKAENIFGLDENAYEGLYFGYDFVKKAFISSKDGENWADKIDAPSAVFTLSNGKHCIYVRYGIGSSAKYYCYEYTYTADSWTCSLFECQADRTRLGMLARLNNLTGNNVTADNLPILNYDKDKTTISRLSSSEFVILVSTEDDTKVVSDYSNFAGYETRDTKILVESESSGKPNKLMTIFKQDNSFKSDLSFKTLYTDAYFSYSFATYNSSLKTFEAFDAETPDVEFINGGPNFSVINGGTIQFKFTPSSNYTLANTNNSVLNLYSSTGELSKVSLKLEVSNTDNKEFEDAFNNNNTNYLKAVYNPDGTVSISYTYAEGDGKNLLAGHYDVIFVCEDVEYNISYDAVFTNSTKDLSINSLDNDEVNSGILISINGTTNVDNVQPQTFGGLSYQQKVELKAELGEKSHGYTFVGWQIGERIFMDLPNIFNFDYASYYNQYGADRTLIVKAIYLRRTVNISLANLAKVESTRGNSNINCVEIDLLLNGQAGFNQDYIFSKKSGQEINFNFVKQNGGVANAYYFTGYELCYFSGGEYISVGGEAITENSNNASNSDYFNIIDVLNADMEINGDVTRYYIMPVLSQKEIEIFVHAGTGDAENQYGDQKYGTVSGSYGDMVGFDVNNQFFSQYFKIDDEKVYYATNKTEIDLNNADGYKGFMYLNGTQTGVQRIVNPSLLYTQRVGYYVPNFTGFWSATSETSGRTFSLAGNNLVLSNFFTNAPNESLVKIHVYRAWEAYNYYLNFNITKENGTVANGYTLSSVLATYDRSVDNTSILNKNQILKTGYSFVGWYFTKPDGTAVRIFDEDANLVDNNVLFNALGEYKNTGNVELFAHFETLNYNVRIFVNGATEIEGKDISTQENYLDFVYLFEDVVYDSRFVNASGIKLFDLIKNLKITRKGFEFDGLYATSGGQVQMISESTTFNANILSVNLNNENALDLFVMWKFEEDVLNFGFVDDNFKNRTYNPNAVNQTIYLAEILKDNLNLTGFEIEVDESGTEFTFKLVGVDSVSLTLSLSSNDAETTLEQLGEKVMAYFVVNSAKNYVVNFNVKVEDNSNYLALGSLFNETYSLYLKVNKAGVGFDLTKAQEKQIRLINVKEMVKPFVTTEIFEIVNSKNDFEEIMKALGEKYLIRAEQLDTKEKIEDILYRYLMYKYYNMTMTNDGSTQVKFKSEYEYYDFEETYFDVNENNEYINKAIIDNIINSLNFFVSYDYSNFAHSLEVDKYNGNLTLNTPDLTIDKIMFSSSTGDVLTPKSNSVMRIYVTEILSGSLENYNYNTDENGNYINFNEFVFVMPETLKITNSGAKNSYFEPNLSRKMVNWSSKESIKYNDETYYLADNSNANIYVRAYLYTSNAGISDKDVVFSYTDKTNFLYFSIASIILEKDGAYVDVSNYYKLVMDEADTYSILSVAGVAKVNLNATYLTLENGQPVRGNLDELENYNMLSLLSITSVSYAYKYDETNVLKGTISGKDLKIGDNNIEVPSSEDSSVLIPITICVIQQNNDNTVSVYLNRWVTKAEFAINQTQIDNYALYEWCLNENRTYSVNGTMESRNSVTVVPTFDGQTNDVEVDSSSKVFEVNANSENGLSTTDICAVFTDLVYVAYDYNLPPQLISNLALASGTNLKIDVSTLADLRNSYPKDITGVGGLVLGDVTLSSDGKNFLAPSEFFTGDENESVFKGKTGNVHSALTVKSVWTISELTATQNINSLEVAVQSLANLSASDVVSVSANENLYDFVYNWQRDIDGSWKDIETEKPDILTFANGGTVKDSGNYRLTISVKTKDILNGYVEDKTLSQSYDFEINFKKHLVTNIDLPTNLTDVYTSSDLLLTNSSKTSVTLSYKQWNNETGSYDQTIQTSVQNFLTKGSLGFAVKYFANAESTGEDVTEMINTGRYAFSVVPNADIFQLDASMAETYQFDYVVTAYQLELSQIGTLTWSKTFFNSDPALEIVHTYGNDTMTLQFEREAGERTTYTDASGNKVNLYDVWLSSVLNVNLNNYAFKFNGTLIDLESEEKVAVGNFTINAGGALSISYEITDLLPKTLTQTYSGGVYTVEFDEEGNFVINLNGVAVYTIKPVLVDNLKGEVTGDYYEILKNELQNISAYFASSSHTFENGVTNASTYSYQFAVGDFGRYYSTVEFDGAYSFVINRQNIDVSSMDKISKTFDNTNFVYVDLNGNVIEDLSSHVGVYLTATYSTIHAGTDITINLELNYNGEYAESYLANYTLSARTTTGEIKKVDATLTINLNETLDASSFVYGNVSTNNLSLLVDAKQPVNIEVDGVDHTDWLDNLYCTLIYNVDDENVNSNGNVYAGKHVLTASNSLFNDFNITNITGAEFTITAYQFEYTIPANLFIENTVNVVKDVYTTQVSVTGLNETIDLQFEIDDENLVLNDDGTAQNAGNYHLALVGNGLYANDSIQVTISNLDTNKGMTIVAEVNVLYLVIDDISDLSQYYNNKDYHLQLLLEDGKYVLEITSDDESFVTRKLSTHLQNSAGTTVDVADIADVTLNLNVTAKIAGKYALNVTFTGSNILYTNFICGQFFTVEKVKIDVESASFKQALKKQYDGTYTKTISEFDEKISGTNVTILANFNNDPNAGVKDVTLLLQGSDSQNYELKFKDETNKVSGEILKADATIQFVHEYAYGDLSTNKNADNFGVLFDVVLSSDPNVKITQYTISSFNVLSPVISGVNLCVGTYNVNIVISAINYNINFESLDLGSDGNLDLKIVVNKFETNLVLDRNGMVSASYMTDETLTAMFDFSDISSLNEQFTVVLERELNENGSLSDVGYYRVKAGNYTDKSGNYLFRVVDNSEKGAYQITISTETQYLMLAENGNQVNANKVVSTISSPYIGVQFDTINVEYSEELGFYLQISNSLNENDEKIVKQLAFYTFDETANVYNKTNINVVNLNVELAFYSSFVKNVGRYGIYTLASTSGNYQIQVGMKGETICFTLEINERVLTFKDSVLQKTFDNKPATMTYQGYAQLNSVVNGAIENEDLGLLVEFYDGANLAVHTKNNLTVKAILTKPNGSSISLANYKLEGLSADGTVVGVTGSIIRAGLTVVIDTQKFVYGQIVQTGGTDTNLNTLGLTYSCQPDFEYDQNLTLDFALTLPNGVDDFSSARLLKAGNYNLTMTGNFADFEISTVVLNGTTVAYTESLYIPLKVERKMLTVRSLTAQSLSEILTKAYDGTKEINIAGLIGLNGIETDDIVMLAGAEFETAHIGSTVYVNFKLMETGDFENYTVSQAVGSITPIIINVSYNDNTPSGITATSPAKRISEIKFPLSGTNLTTNSNDSSTSSSANFPSTLGGWEGHYLLGWQMTFENVESTSDEYNFLKNYGSYDSATKMFTVSIDNDVRSVNFLNALLNETDGLFENAYFFKGKANINVTFNAVWDVLKYNVSIKVTDRDGSVNSGLGTVDVVVTDENGQTTYDSLTNQTISVAHGASITITANANEHCIFNNIYNRTDNVSSNFANAYTISDVKKNYEIWASFTVDEVDVVLDLSEYKDDITITGGRGLNFTKQGNVFTAKVDYLSFEKLKFSNLPNIANALFDLKGWSDGTDIVLKENFATTDLSNMLPSGKTLTLYAVFTVAITLNFNDGMTNPKIVSLDYGEKYFADANIMTAPTREGFDFAGWYVGETLIDENTEIVDAKAHTISANWTVKKYNISITAQNSSIESEILTQNGNVYTANLEFSTNLTFTVIADAGYEISESGWAKEFNVISYSKTRVTVVLTVPANDVDFVIPTLPLSNHVTLSWNGNVDNIVIKNETDNITLTLDHYNKFNISTGKVVSITITPEVGYTLTENIIFSKQVDYTTKLEKGVLTLTITSIHDDMEMEFEIVEGINKVTFLLGEDLDAYDTLTILGRNYTSDDFTEGKIEVDVYTNTELNVSVKFKHGFMGDGCVSVRYVIENINQVAVDGNYVMTFDVTSIAGDSKISLSTKRLKYNVNLQVVAYDGNGNVTTTTLNDAEIDGYGKTATGILFGNNVTLKLKHRESDYTFVGFADSMTGGDYNILSNAESFVYSVLDNVTVYAVFSTRTYYLSFDVAEYYRIEHTQNGQPAYDVYNKFETKDLPVETITDLSGNAISTAEIKLGMAVTVMFKPIYGFRYYGLGIMDNNIFKPVEVTEHYIDGKVEITISSKNIGSLVGNGSDVVNLMFLVSSYEVSLDVGSYIYIDGNIEDDNYNPHTGKIVLQNSEGNLANEYGYVAGTRVHYLDNVTDNAHFTVIAYTGNDVYLKVNTVRNGYTFFDLITNNQDLTVELVSQQDGAFVYKLSGLVGGLGQNVSVLALFKPQLNTINLSFTDENGKVNGGAIVINVDEFNANKVYSTGDNYSSVIVSAYTDSRFTVFAYVRLGYHIDPINMLIAEDYLVNNVRFTSLSVENTGYTGLLSFEVSNYLDLNNIQINLMPTTYTVNLVDENKTIVKIKNVSYNSVLNLSAENENIEILDNSVGFDDGKLGLVLQKSNYNYEGFFTYAGGSGVQYIDSEGNVVKAWQETGYIFNGLTNKYELSKNATVTDTETEINLYVYFSYFKTRFNFEFVPDITTSYTAEDIISGVDYTNSWFYGASPLYMEVAFDTHITITAPNLNGYRFYKYEIIEKNKNGDVTEFVGNKYSRSVDWSTNESESIVECTVRIYYFAQIQVEVLGGQGSFEIEQTTDDAQGQQLVKDGFVDTERQFTIKATASEGYDFVRWTDAYTGKTYISNNGSLTLSTTEKLMLLLVVKGKPVSLNFNYVADNGVLIDLSTSSGTSVRLGQMVGGEYKIINNNAVVKVGDEVIFRALVNKDFAVNWSSNFGSLPTPTATSYYDEVRQYIFYSLMITPEFVGTPVNLSITFEASMITIVVNSDFTERDKTSNTTDGNDVRFAGRIKFKGNYTDYFKVQYNQNIKIEVEVFEKYKLASVTLRNYNRVFEFNDISNNEILLTIDYLLENKIVGLLQIEVRFTRLLWENETFENTEFKGQGTEEKHYEIWTAEDLSRMMQYINSGKSNADGKKYTNCFFMLMADINLSKEFWTPIGSWNNYFNGTFNFNGHEITGITNAKFFDVTSHNGLFGVLGGNANIIENQTSLWLIFLIIGVCVFLVVMVVVILIINYRMRKRRKAIEGK